MRSSLKNSHRAYQKRNRSLYGRTDISPKNNYKESKKTDKNICPECGEKLNYNYCSDKKTETVTIIYETWSCSKCDYRKETEKEI